MAALPAAGVASPGRPRLTPRSTAAVGGVGSRPARECGRPWDFWVFPAVGAAVASAPPLRGRHRPPPASRAGRPGRLRSSAPGRWGLREAEAALAELRPEGWRARLEAAPVEEDPERLHGEVGARGLARILDWLAAAEAARAGPAAVADPGGAGPGALRWPHGRGAFWDLGSGAGSATVLAALLRPFARCGGVEVRPALHRAAEELAAAFSAPAARARLPFPAAGLEFVCGDCCPAAGRPPCWAGADVVLLHATAFGARLLGNVARAATHLREGAWLVSISRPLPGAASGLFTTEGQARLPMEYGAAQVYFQRRTGIKDDDLLAYELDELMEDEAVLQQLLAGGADAKPPVLS